MRNDNLVRVGKKDKGSYLYAIAYKLKQGLKEIRLVAYGRNVQKALSIAGMAKQMGLRESIEYVETSFPAKSPEGKPTQRKINGVIITLIKE